MRKMKFVSIFILLALLLSAGPGAVLTQEPPPDDTSIRGLYGTIVVRKDTGAYDYTDRPTKSREKALYACVCNCLPGSPMARPC